MFHELAAADYPRVRALVASLSYHLSIQAVIDGTVAGSIWVDDVQHPWSTFIMTPEGQYLAGASDNLSFQRALSELLLTTMPTVNLAYSPAAWESTFAALLACKFARPCSRHYYAFQRFLLPDWRDQVPPGYAMAQVDQAFLAREDLVHLDDVRERTTEWTSYARDGFGFCLLHGATIVSHCIADCVSGNACELGVETHRDYRRRGLATLTVAAAVEHSLARGLSAIGWHCWANNRGSQRVAEKVGLRFVGAYVQYANSMVAENPDDLTPAEWHAQGDYYERASEILSEHATWMTWRAAQSRALAGQRAQAMTLLTHLAGTGTMPPGWDVWLRESSAFQGLRTEPAWPALLASAQASRPNDGDDAT